MKEFKVCLLIALMAILYGCGGEKEKEPAETSGGVAEMSEEDKVKVSMTELIERMVEGDKTVLYEHEFNYYTDDISLSDYMKISWVKDYAYDTLRGIEYDSVKIIGDSAIVDAKIIYESKAGGEKKKAYRFTMYNYNGKWIKPYQSKFNEEMEYLESKRAYDSAAAAEEAERLGH